MASKFIALFALVAVASAQHYNNDYYQSNQYDNHHYDNHHYSAPVVKHIQPAIVKQIQPALIKTIQPVAVKHVQHEEPANYEFNYDVHDHHTGDIKQQREVAHNGAIQGEYSLIDADGYRRVVSYTADDHQGFIAHVRREPIEGHKIVAHQPTVAKLVTPVHKVIAQPAIAIQKVAPIQHHYSAQPQQYSAPQYYSAPQQQYSAPQYYSAPQQQQYSAPQYYSAPVQHKYVAPVQHQQQYQYSAPAQLKVALPVQKYIAPAPVVEKYVAPVQKYTVAPIKTVVAQPIKYTSAEHSAHVSVNSPNVNYHY